MYFQYNNTLSSSSPSICICQLYLSKVIFVLTQLIHNLADRSCSGVISQSYYRKKDILETASGGFRDDDDETVLLSSFTFPGTWNLSRFKLKCWKYKVWFAVLVAGLAPSVATNPNQPGSGNQEKNCHKHSTIYATAVVNERTSFELAGLIGLCPSTSSASIHRCFFLWIIRLFVLVCLDWFTLFFSPFSGESQFLFFLPLR